MTGSNEASTDWQSRWKRKHNWNESEVAKLCCGWNPEDGAIPDAGQYALALEAVRRAVRAKALIPIDPEWEPKLSDKMYGTAALFSPASVIPWASREYPDTFVFRADAAEERKLDPRERTTLLSIIAAFADLAGVDLTTPAQAAEDVATALRRRGIEKDPRTIERQLKLALAQVSREV